MELLRPLTLSGVSFADHSLIFPRVLSDIIISASFSKPHCRPSRTFPRLSTCASSSSPALPLLSQQLNDPGTSTTRWIVLMEKYPTAWSSRAEIVDYYVQTLARVVGSEREAQMCIYHASCESNFGFCCDIDEESSRDLARIEGVISVKPDNTPEAGKKDYSHHSILPADYSNSDLIVPKFSSSGNDCTHWLVRIDKPGFEMVTKAQMVDYYAQILTKILRNEKDSQVSLYHISWEKDLGFCCQIDEQCAKELSYVPGVLSVTPDFSFGSENKSYKGTDGSLKSNVIHDSSEASLPDVKTKRLFVTGLSFYTSEKTLRAAFEGFGELVEVKVIMDKISKRSKGYAFIEYTTEAAAGAALKEMNGKIINGWMIVVDVARTNASGSARVKESGQTSTSSLNQINRFS